MHFVLYLQPILHIPEDYLEFFQQLDKNSPYNIKVNLKNSNGKIVVKNVLGNKTINQSCPEITKLGNLSNILRENKKHREKIDIVEIIITKNNSPRPKKIKNPNKLAINGNTLIINGESIDLNNIKEITLVLNV